MKTITFADICNIISKLDREETETIINHGRYAAAKWAGHPTDRAYWEARYCGIQALYSDLLDSPAAYADFNARCGVTFEAGHITAWEADQVRKEARPCG